MVHGPCTHESGVHREGAGGVCVRRVGGRDVTVAIGRPQSSRCCCCCHVNVARMMMCGPGRDQDEGKGGVRAGCTRSARSVGRPVHVGGGARVGVCVCRARRAVAGASKSKWRHG